MSQRNDEPNFMISGIALVAAAVFLYPMSLLSIRTPAVVDGMQLPSLPPEMLEFLATSSLVFFGGMAFAGVVLLIYSLWTKKKPAKSER